MTRIWWHLYRVSAFISAPLHRVTEFFRDKWEISANQYWIDHPLEYAALNKALLEILEEDETPTNN